MKKSLGHINFDDISISPKYRVSDWKKFRDMNNWGMMTELFLDRIESRYLKPVRHISADENIGEFVGFAVLALDCLIIETLHQFYEGIDETEGEHRKAFWDFFKKSEYFKDSFSRKKAFIFYSHFRCGILHQAQTKRKSLVRSDDENMIEPVTKTISDGLIVNRKKFHEALEKEIRAYIAKLKSSDTQYYELRKNFIKKMNIISGINKEIMPNPPIKLSHARHESAKESLFKV